MSKFIESLKNKTRIAVQPMGFRSAAAKSRPLIFLIAGISPATKDVPDSIAGADAVLFSPELPQSLVQSVANLPRGVRLKEPPAAGPEKNPGPDFVVFNFDLPVFSMSSDTGKVLEIELSISDSILRSVEDLPLDAVLVSDKFDTLNWQLLAQIQRIDNLISKFILVKVHTPIEAGGLQMLWQAGTDGVLIEPVIDKGEVPAVRSLIDKTDFPLPRKVKKAGATIPVIPAQSAVPAKEEEEEEEEGEE